MKQIKPILGQMLKKIAPRIGAKIVLEPVWGIAGQIIYSNGRRRYFRYSTLDLNPVGSAEISKDKDYAAFFMKKMGYPVIEGKTFFATNFAKALKSKDGIDAAFLYARKLGLPVIVKPNSGSQGDNVALVYSQKEFYAAMNAIFKRDRVALVQRLVSGNDYRVVVLDDRVISAYERTPLHVTGDGKKSIAKLLALKQHAFEKAKRDTQLNPKDPRIIRKLARMGYTLRTILLDGETVFLLDNANLSTGGDSMDVTKKMHPKFKQICVELTKDMGLRFCGVDLMVRGSIADEPEEYWIIETNAAPGLDHYARSGKEQEKIVEEMYLEVLKSMDH